MYHDINMEYRASGSISVPEGHAAGGGGGGMDIGAWLASEKCVGPACVGCVGNEEFGSIGCHFKSGNAVDAGLGGDL